MEKSQQYVNQHSGKKENPITDNYMIWGYRNSLKAWQLWNMKKPHHIKGCEINFYAEIIWNKIKTPRCFITSMSKLGLLGDKLFDTKEVPLEVGDSWAAPWYFVSQRELPSWHKLHIQNFTHRCSWVQLTHNLHYTSPNFTQCSGFYISRLTQWHRLYIQNFVHRSLERSWHKLQSLLTILLHKSTKKVQSLFDLPSDKNFTLYFLTTLPIVDFKFPLLQVIHMSSHW